MEEGDRYTLGLLLELRKLANDAADANSTLANRFHEDPNAPEVAKELPYRVRQFIWAFGQTYENGIFERQH